MGKRELKKAIIKNRNQVTKKLLKKYLETGPKLFPKEYAEMHQMAIKYDKIKEVVHIITNEIYEINRESAPALLKAKKRLLRLLKDELEEKRLLMDEIDNDIEAKKKMKNRYSAFIKKYNSTNKKAAKKIKKLYSK